MEPTLETKLVEVINQINDQKEINFCMQYFYYNRIKALCLVEEEDFALLPISMKLEFLLTKRNINRTVDCNSVWYKMLAEKTKFSEKSCNLIWLNTHHLNNNQIYLFVLENNELIEKTIQHVRLQLESAFPKEKSDMIDHYLRAGLLAIYLDVFNISVNERKSLITQNGKQRIPMMYAIWLSNPEFSMSESKQIAIHNSKNWQEIIEESKLIMRENPRLAAGFCRKLAIGYHKSWRNILAEIVIIQQENPDLLSSECRVLALGYYKKWRKVLAERDIIQKENPELLSSDCKSLAIGYYKTWRKVLVEKDIIQKENPEFPLRDCKILAIGYYRTWRKVLAERDIIQKENPELSPSDCKSLAIGYYKTWRKVLAERDIIQKENPELSSSDCKSLAIGYYKTWRKIVAEATSIRQDNQDLSFSDSMILALHYNNSWKEVLAEEKIIKSENPDLSDSACSQLARRYFRTWREVVTKARNLRAVPFAARYFPTISLFLKIAASRDGRLRSIFPQIVGSILVSVEIVKAMVKEYEAWVTDRDWIKLSLAYALTSAPFASQLYGSYANYTHALTELMQLAVFRFGNNSFHVIQSIQAASKRSEYELRGGYEQNRLVPIQESYEQELVRNEDIQEWQIAIKKVLTCDELQILEDWLDGTPVDPYILQSVFAKIKQHPTANDVLGALKNVGQN